MKIRCVLAVLSALLFAVPSFAQDEPCNGASVDKQTLDAIADPLVRSWLKEKHIPGLTLAIVSCGEVKKLSGYGYADLERQIAVDPQETLFRIGSVSKTLTFTALMQLVESGKVKLDGAVNDYLKSVQLPDYDGQPVQIRDLFAHRPGFEDRSAGILFREDPHDVISLEQWVQTTMPNLVLPPGELTVYSNYGAALAGMVIEQVSGTPFDEYIDDNIFGPLKMTSSSFREPGLGMPLPAMSPNLAEQLATGYTYKRGAFSPHDFIHIWQAAPAGSASATASDMARFMLAHLGSGTLDGGTVLTPEFARKLQTRPFADGPYAPGYAFGFRTGWIKGHKTFEHGGSALYFFTAMLMIPEQNLGIFISVNGSDDHQAPRKIADAIARQLVSNELPIDGWHSPRRLDKDEAHKYDGQYFVNRRSYSRLEKIYYPFIGTRTVKMMADGSLGIAGGPEQGRYSLVAPATFSDPLTGTIVKFDYAKSGQAIRFTSEYGHFGFERTEWWERISLLGILLLAAAIFAVIHLAFVRIRWKSALKENKSASRLLLSISAKSTLQLVMLIALIAGFAELATLGEAVAINWPNKLLFIALLVIIVWIVAVGISAALLIANFLRSTLHRYMVWAVGLQLLDALLIWQLWQWNLWVLAI